MLHEYFVILAVVINAIGGLIYFANTLSGKVKPDKVTWFLWSIVPMIAFFAEIQKGVGLQAMLTFMVGFNPFIIFVTSFFNKKAAWKLGKFDFICGIFAVFGLFLWAITKDANLAILFSIIADGFAGIPTLVKSYKAPQTETPIAYVTTVLSASLVLLTIEHWTFAYYGFPLYLLVMNSTIVLFLQRKQMQRWLVSN